jgi:predicted SnoaL-like aldol condensation-catalyzing enzyme
MAVEWPLSGPDGRLSGEFHPGKRNGEMMRIASTVAEAVLELTGGPDTAAAAARHYSQNFIQHSPIFPGGWDGLIASVDNAKQAGAGYQVLRAIGEGDTAMLHARVTGFAEEPLILFNMYRVEDGKIAEHWEALQPESTQTASGHGMTDGPTEVTDLDRTEDNRDLVRNLIEKVFVGGDTPSLGDYFDGDTLIQHNPQVPDGVSGLRGALTTAAQQGKAVQYVKLHRILAEGNFVGTLSEGTIGGQSFAIFELFRVQDGKIAEHWDVVTPVPDQPPHDNGVF